MKKRIFVTVILLVFLVVVNAFAIESETKKFLEKYKNKIIYLDTKGETKAVLLDIKDDGRCLLEIKARVIFGKMLPRGEYFVHYTQLTFPKLEEETE